MTTQVDPQIVRLDDVRVDYPVFFEGEAKPYKQKGDPFYSGTFLFPKTAPFIAAIVAAIETAAKVKWGEAASTKLLEFKSKDKLPVHDGDIRAAKGQKDYAGMLYFSARNNATRKPPVPVFDKHIDPKTQLPREIKSAADPRAPKAGHYVNVTLRTYAYANEGEGIGAEILGVQRARPIGGDEGAIILRQRLSTAADYQGVPLPAGTPSPAPAASGAPASADAAKLFL